MGRCVLSSLLLWLHDLRVPVFPAAQALALVLAAWVLHAGLVASGAARRARCVALMVVGCVAGCALLGITLRLPRTLLSGSHELFAPGWLMAYGALLGAAAGVGVATRGDRPGRARALDALAPGLGVLVLFGRIGCFAAGCCFGHVSEGALSIGYPEGTPAFAHHAALGWGSVHAAVSPPVLAVPLVEAGLGGVMFALGLALRRRARPGDAFALVLAVYAVGRLLLELLRADPRPMALGWSLPQWIGVVVLAWLLAARLWAPAGEADPIAK